MKVTNYWLEGVDTVPAHDVGGHMAHPSVVVIHYTAGNFDSSLRTLTAPTDPKVSAHVLIDRDGSITQTVGFDRIAYHAGVSQWQGRPGVNTFGFGLELVNLGWHGKPLRRDSKVYGSLVAAHKNGGRYLAWEPYAEAQVEAAASVCKALVEAYGPLAIVGHDDIAPGRKLDPGPAWDMPAFIERVRR
jgi:N-acetylmuramoyl-L-alanine amidase